jgi:hypothetical protein
MAKNRVTVTVSFTLDPTEDRDLLRWLEKLPRGQKSAAIRAMLRAGLGQGGVTLGDVYQAVKTLERKIQVGAVVTEGPAVDPDWPEEPPAAVAALDELAKR